MSTDYANALGLEQGTLIHGRYEIRSLLGRGGFAAVFKAHDREIERDVAIKVLNVGPLVSQGNELDLMLTRFKREAKLSARISHPSVVQIFDFGVLDDEKNPFIIMEMLDGHDLGDELKENGPMTPERAIPLFVDALEALGDAHQMGIVHKDLKPSNLFVTDPGARRENLKIVDFGIAHIGDDDNNSRLTQTGYMLGTTQYMTPEYVEEQSVSPGLDVYQMGLILVETLAGKPVVHHESPWKCALMHISRELSVPVELLSSPLGPIIEKALAFEPEERFAHAGEFADALDNVDMEGIPTLSATCECRYIDTLSSEIIAPSPASQEVLKQALTSRREVDSQVQSVSGDTLPNHGGADADFHEAKTELTSDVFPQTPSGQEAAPPASEDSGSAPLDSHSGQKAADPGQNPTANEKDFGYLEPTTDTGDNLKSNRHLVGIVIALAIAICITAFVATQLLNDEEEPEPDVYSDAVIDESESSDDPPEDDLEPTPQPAGAVAESGDEPDEVDITEGEDGEDELAEKDDEPAEEDTPDAEPESEPEPQPEPTPQPTPAPEPTPQPTPEPEPTPQPTPDPEEEDDDEDDDGGSGLMIAP